MTKKRQEERERREVLILSDIKKLIDNSDIRKLHVKYCYKLIEYLGRKVYVEGRKSNNYTFISHKNLERFYNYRYYIWFNRLKELNIIEEKVLYKFVTQEDGEINQEVMLHNYLQGDCCRSFRINTSLISDFTDYTSVDIYVAPKSAEWDEEDRSSSFFGSDESKEYIRSLRFPFTEMEALITSQALRKLKKIKVNDEIEEQRITLTDDNRNEENMPYLQARKLAKRLNKDLVFDGKRFRIESADRFKNEVAENVKMSLNAIIQNLKKGKFYAGRSWKTGRVHTNLSEMPKVFLKIIKRVNNLIEIDADNSQFCHFSDWMESQGVVGDDVTLFCSLSRAGKIYDYISEQFSLDRKIVKEKMFYITFAANKSRTPSLISEKTTFKTEVKKLFPTVIQFMNDKKKAYKPLHKDDKKPYAQFAVHLQKMEAEFIIDVLYRTLYHGIFILTKHDSLIIRKEDLQFVMDTIKIKSEENNYKGTFTVKKEQNTTLIMDNKNRILDTIQKNSANLKEETSKPVAQPEPLVEPVVEPSPLQNSREAQIIHILPQKDDMVLDKNNETIPYWLFEWREEIREKAERLEHMKDGVWQTQTITYLKSKSDFDTWLENRMK
jgi:hypothetical protein